MKRVLLLLVLMLVAVPAFATLPSVIQCKTNPANINTTDTITFDSTPTVGNHVLSGVAGYGFTTSVAVTGFSDNKSNSYALNASPTFSVSPWYNVAAGSAKITSSSATFTVTVTTNQSLFAYWAVCEVANMDPSAWFDAATSGNVTGGTAKTVTRGGANSTANAFVFAILSTQPGTTLSDPSSGYTRLVLDQAGIPGISIAYKIVSASETSSAAWTFASGDALGMVAVYKGVDAAGASGGSRSLTGAGR